MTLAATGRYSRNRADTSPPETPVLQEAQPLTVQQTLLMVLTAKIATIALVAIVLVRYHRFRALLIFERRAWPEKLVITAGLGVPLAALVATRLLLRYDALDLTLEGPFLAGLITGPHAGGLVGLIIALPALLAGQWIALPFAIGCGYAGGGLREMCPKEAIWHFSPFVFTTLHRRAWQLVRHFQVDWHLLLILAPIGLELIRLSIGRRFGANRLFYFEPQTAWMTFALLLATVLSVATPIRIWNTARIEHKLGEQEKLLMTSRMEALASQINPHFLFNTLASVSSLIRSEPEKARMLINRLSSLLRRHLRSRDLFVPLRDELQSVDDYLDIELVRFGTLLRVEKEIGPDTLEAWVPSMLLQPLVENSIKHGLGPKVGGGTITVRSRLVGGRTEIEVADDGLGMAEDRLKQAFHTGIGLSNVAERLRVIYGASAGVTLESRLGAGTVVRLAIPELALPVTRSV